MIRKGVTFLFSRHALTLLTLIKTWDRPHYGSDYYKDVLKLVLNGVQDFPSFLTLKILRCKSSDTARRMCPPGRNVSEFVIRELRPGGKTQCSVQKFFRKVLPAGRLRPRSLNNFDECTEPVDYQTLFRTTESERNVKK